MTELTEKDWIIARLLYAATSTGMLASNPDIIKTMRWFGEHHAVATTKDGETRMVPGRTTLLHMYAAIEAEQNTTTTYDTWLKNGVRG